VAAVLLPTSIAAASASDDPAAAATHDDTSVASLHAEARLMRAQTAGGDPLASVEAVAEAVAPPTTALPTTTTTTVPPTTTTTVPAPQAVQPAAGGSGYNDPNNPAAWDRLAQCESGGNWGANTGNGYYGGIQFSLSSWQAVGGTGYPHQASRETQIAMGQRLWNQGGWHHWPACSSRLGYR
jgi:hypothetical protein